MTKDYHYDAFGVEVAPEDGDLNPFRYCGEYFDSETGNVYLRARYYTPTIGRFSAEDPINDGLNWYTYCNGNPVGYFDPSGLIRQPGYNAKGVMSNECSCNTRRKLAVSNKIRKKRNRSIS